MKKTWRTFEDARRFARALGFLSTAQWYAYAKSGQRPADIPSNPSQVYREAWHDWHDWLGTQKWHSFEQARAYARGLGLVTHRQWKAYAKSGQRPADIPSNPQEVYAADWLNWHDWLGKSNLRERRKPKSGWRSFEQARAYARGLGFVTAQQWYAHSKSGQRPVDIPSSPDRAYREQWQDWHDWLGGRSKWRLFEEARAFVHSLHLLNNTQWWTYCASGQRPADIPANPPQVYAAQWRDWHDWLGKPTPREKRKPKSGWRPFEQARAYAHTLGFTTLQQWYEHCASGHCPADIPSTPDKTYQEEFLDWKDWLKKQSWRSFEEARTSVRALKLKSKVQWEEYCRSGEKPPDIPSSPSAMYKHAFRGYQDWLGLIHTWNKNALLSLLQDMRKHIPLLGEDELYTILDRNGALSGLCAVLRTRSVQPVLRDLIENEGKLLEAHLTCSSQEVLDLPLEREDTLDTLLHHWSAVDRSLLTEQALATLDTLASLPHDLDEATMEYLITNRVSSLWECLIHEGEQRVEALLSKGGESRYFEEIMRRFLAEKAAVEALPIPPGWAFTDHHGKPCLPNLMQRRVAWLVRTRRRVGNWSGVGWGKTLSAILASRVIDASLTLVLTTNPTLDQWEEHIKNAYPESIVFHESGEVSGRCPGRSRYVLLNYEKFQGEKREARVAALLQLRPDFVVLDEIQCVKQRGKQMSQRRARLERLMQALPSCAVLGMSATPLINDLTEAKKILELTTGLPLTEVSVKPTVNHALEMHRLFLFHGIRSRPVHNQDLAVKTLKVQRNDLLDAVLQASKNLLKIEQILLPAKLEAVRPYIQRSVVIYTQYITEIVDPIEEYMEAMGFKVGRCIGTEKGGLEAFKRGDIDILIGSPAMCIGIDGLQMRANRIIMLSPPWTHAAYEQIIGRLHRPGSSFARTELIIPHILLRYEQEVWSWDERRYECIAYKRTLSDCVLDGRIPETSQIDHQKFLQQSSEALEQWIGRVNRGMGGRGLVENDATDHPDSAPQEYANNRDPQLDRAIAEALKIIEERPALSLKPGERPSSERSNDGIF